MKKFMDWLANSFAPKAKKLTQKAFCSWLIKCHAEIDSLHYDGLNCLLL